MALGKIIENLRKEAPDQPETFSKIYRKQHLSEQIDKILLQSYTIQKLVERFSIETTMKRIRLVMPDMSEEEAHKLVKSGDGLQTALKMKLTGNASLKLKYKHEDILSKAR